jgi:hypothetical protein
MDVAQGGMQLQGIEGFGWADQVNIAKAGSNDGIMNDQLGTI